LELSPKVIDKIDQEIGIRTETDPIFGKYEHFEVSKEPRFLYKTKLVSYIISVPGLPMGRISTKVLVMCTP
jgi:hypothetical protein